MSDSIDYRFNPSKSANEATERFLGGAAAKQESGRARIDLDSAVMIETHQRLMGQYLQEMDRQAEPRAEMERDEAIYDHIHYSAQDRAILEERGQVPLVFNLVHTSCNWLLGKERRARMDFKLLARRKDGVSAAARKSEFLRYLRDVNHSHMASSAAFAEVVKAGLSWLEAGYRSEDDGEPVYDRMESWRNVIHDSASRELDYTDARFLFRTRWTDVDLAMAIFPKRSGVIAAARSGIYQLGLGGLDAYGDQAMDSSEREMQDGIGQYAEIGTNFRERVRLIEAWYRVPAKDSWISGGQFSGEVFDENSPGHIGDVETGRATVVAKTGMRTHVAIFTSFGLIYSGPSIYRHNRFPLTPIWGYRRAHDGMPYGYIRGVVDPQMDLNKRASKALYLLSTRRAFVPRGSVRDMEEFREEAARPDAVIEYTPVAGQIPRIDTDLNLASAHVGLMDKDAQMIQAAGGVTDENMGRQTNATSGRAILARQDQGELATSILFDNYRFARMLHGEKMVVNVEQFVTKAREFRITDQRGTAQFMDMNGDGEEAVNIAAFKADFIIGEEEWRASQRQADLAVLLEVLAQIAPQAPMIALAILDLVVEMMDLPNGDEVVKRIRQISGQSDPDADPNNPTPEEMEMQAAKTAEAEMQQRAMQAELAEKEAKAMELAARARKTNLEADKADAAKAHDILAQIQTALTIATGLIQVPQAAPVADRVMATAQASAAPLPQPEQIAPPAPAAPQPQQPILM